MITQKQKDEILKIEDDFQRWISKVLEGNVIGNRDFLKFAKKEDNSILMFLWLDDTWYISTEILDQTNTEIGR